MDKYYYKHELMVSNIENHKLHDKVESLERQIRELNMENAELKDMVRDLGGDYTHLDEDQMTLDFKPTKQDGDV